MADRVDKPTRHKIMAANPAKDTGPEVEVRKALFNEGFRYRLHGAKLPGRPDVVLPSRKVVIFVHGCYWHGHECRRKPCAKSNTEFWRQKVARNRRRDLAVRNELLQLGWRVIVIWECAVRRRDPPFAESEGRRKVVDWINGSGRLALLSECGFEECL